MDKRFHCDHCGEKISKTLQAFCTTLLEQICGSKATVDHPTGISCKKSPSDNFTFSSDEEEDTYIGKSKRARLGFVMV